MDKAQFSWEAKDGDTVKFLRKKRARRSFLGRQ
jgi:hypothetical protein